MLQFALADANTNLETQVGIHPLTTAKKIQNALNDYMADKTDKAKYKVLVKEIYRLIRAKTRVDQGSDTEGDSDA